MDPNKNQASDTQMPNNNLRLNQQPPNEQHMHDTNVQSIRTQKPNNPSPVQSVINQVEPKQISLPQLITHRSEGSFGKVQIVVDQITSIVSAVKSFKEINGYLEEKNKYEELIEDYKEQLQKLNQLAILPQQYKDDEKTIIFQPGVCSLKELIDKPTFSCTADQAVHVFSVLLDFVLLMKEQGYCHQDLKPANTQLVRINGTEDQYCLKIIDLGSIRKNDLNYEQYTAAFFKSPLRTYNQNGYLQFQNMEERFKNEFYTVIRTMQNLLVGHKNELFQIGKNYQKWQKRLLNLKKLQMIINKKYQKLEKSHLLHQILRFITEKGIEEKYSFDDLKDLQIKVNKATQQTHFSDPQQLIKQIIDENQKKSKHCNNPLDLLFGLNCFINQYGSLSEYYSEPFELLTMIKQHLFEDNDNKSDNLFLIGQSGAGKTLFLIKLMKELQDQKPQQHVNYHSVLVKLRYLSNKDNNLIKQQLCQKITEQINEQNQNYKQLLIVLLDGFDELNNKNINLASIIKDNFQNYPKIKIIVTMRSNYATEIELNQVFNTQGAEVFKKFKTQRYGLKVDTVRRIRVNNNPIKFYICPFNKNQIHDYIDNFLNNQEQYKDSMNQQEKFQVKEEYSQIIDSQCSINQLATLPFTLSLVIMMMPELKKSLQEQK